MAENPALTWHQAREMSPEDRVAYYCVRDEETGCLIWTGAKTSGYGIVQIAGHSHRVHQWVWENENGPVPVGHHLHHRCHTKACCDTSHLEMMEAGAHNLTHGTRGQAALNLVKTHCKNDHEFTEANTYLHDGQRKCRACRADAARRFRAMRKD